MELKEKKKQIKQRRCVESAYYYTLRVGAGYDQKGDGRSLWGGLTHMRADMGRGCGEGVFWHDKS